MYLFSRVLCTCLISTSCVFYQYYYYVFDQLSIPCLISWVLCIPSAECYVFHLQSICSGEYCVFYQMSIVHFIRWVLCILSAENYVFDQLSIVYLISWVLCVCSAEYALILKIIQSEKRRDSKSRRSFLKVNAVQARNDLYRLHNPSFRNYTYFAPYLFISLSIHVTYYLHIHHLYFYPSIYLFIYLSFFISINRSFYLSTYSSVLISIYPSTYLSIYLSIDIAIYNLTVPLGPEQHKEPRRRTRPRPGQERETNQKRARSVKAVFA